MAQSKCPDPATSGSEHSGARHLSIFSPRTTQCTHMASRTGHPRPGVTRGPHTQISYMLTAHTSHLVSSTPTHTHLARSARWPDHGLRPSYIQLFPASTAPSSEHSQAKALGGLTRTIRATRTHQFPSSHNAHPFLPIHMLFHPTQTFFPNYPIDWIRVTIYDDHRMMPLGQLPAIRRSPRSARSSKRKECRGPKTITSKQKSKQ